MEDGPFCIQGMEVYETGDAGAKGVPKNSIVIHAHVCDGCRHKGGEIHIDMIDANGHGRAIVYSATNAAALSTKIMHALSTLPNQSIDVPEFNKLKN